MATEEELTIAGWEEARQALHDRSQTAAPAVRRKAKRLRNHRSVFQHIVWKLQTLRSCAKGERSRENIPSTAPMQGGAIRGLRSRDGESCFFSSCFQPKADSEGFFIRLLLIDDGGTDK